MNLSSFQALLAKSAFADLVNAKQIQITQLNLFIRFLIEANLTFFLSYSQRTNATRGTVVIDIPLTPTFQITFEFELCP